MNIFKKTLIAASLAAVSVGASAADPLYASTGKINIEMGAFDAGYVSQLSIDINGTTKTLFSNDGTTAVGTTETFAVIQGDALDFSMTVTDFSNNVNTYYWDASANTDSFDHFVFTLPADGIDGRAFIGFEDKFGGGDGDFDDFTFYAYDVSESSIASTVPEASTIAMMLGGLGLVGFMARRRKA